MGCSGGKPYTGPELNAQALRRLTLADEETAVDVMSRSFAGTQHTAPEGVFNFFMGPTLEEQWTNEARLNFVRYFMRWIFITGVKWGEVYGADVGSQVPRQEVLGADQKPSSLGVVTVIFPPGTLTNKGTATDGGVRFLHLMKAMKGPPPNYAAKTKLLYPGSAQRMDEANKQMHECHATANTKMEQAGAKIAGGYPAHFYLNVLAVAPEWQGNGFGKIVLSALLERADAQDAACYLETVGDRNRGIYERAGFTHHFSGTLDKGLSEGQSPLDVHFMWHKKSLDKE